MTQMTRIKFFNIKFVLFVAFVAKSFYGEKEK